ncbi:MAG: type II secretion system protein [Candidatus Eremiobacteraeota bacterium]|nr:type II secretion system protein [Candidatus Eremiobacteraeota bacterium]
MKRRGLTLVESVVAATVLGLTAIFLLTLLPSGLLSLRRANQRTQAATVADSVLAEYRLKDLASLPLGAQPGLTPVAVEGVEYRRALAVETVAGLPQARLLRAEVRFTNADRERTVTRQLIVSLMPR